MRQEGKLVTHSAAGYGNWSVIARRVLTNTGMTAVTMSLLFLITTLAVSAHPAAAQEQALVPAGDSELVTLKAVVKNGTTGASVPEQLLITLQVFDLEDTELQRLEAETGAGGLVEFGGVIATDVTYTLSAAYNDVRFFSDVYLSSIERLQPLELTLFEPTSDPSVIRIIGDSSAITPPDDDSGILRVLQITTFENTSDRAYVGDDPLNTRRTIQLPLPVMAFDLEPVHIPGSLVLAPDSREVYSIIPVMPGVEEQIVAYSLLYTTDVFAWSKTYPYATEVARLLVPKELSFRPGSQWVQMQDSEVSGVTYARYEMGSIIAGQILNGTVADLPRSAGSRSRSLEQTLRDVALAVVVAALIIAAGFTLWWGYFRPRKQRGGAPGTRQAVQEERDGIVLELARLQNERDTGALSEEEYAEGSSPLRERLRRILEEEQAG